jgi:hypothetical protein
MAISLYSGFVPVCLQLLGGLKTVLQKAEEHATAQKWYCTRAFLPMADQTLPQRDRHPLGTEADVETGMHSYHLD